RAPIVSVDKIDATTNSHRVADTAVAERNPKLRPEVQKAMRALREMPPFARERAIKTGRYSRLSPEEREALRNFESQLPDERPERRHRNDVSRVRHGWSGWNTLRTAGIWCSNLESNKEGRPLETIAHDGTYDS